MIGTLRSSTICIVTSMSDLCDCGDILIHSPYVFECEDRIRGTCDDKPIMATCPGRLSVGTLVWDTPKAPRFSTIDLRYGATTSVVELIDENPFGVNNRSARRPSPIESVLGRRNIHCIRHRTHNEH